jgi:hypothetical protein
MNVEKKIRGIKKCFSLYAIMWVKKIIFDNHEKWLKNKQRMRGKEIK